MLLNRSQRSINVREEEQIHGVLRTHWVLGVCVVCTHELPCAENYRTTCPGCGAQLHFFPLYRRPELRGMTAPSAHARRAILRWSPPEGH
jgi:hypothetical protein